MRNRLTRFRRWLAWKLMPGTDEYAAALARQQAQQSLAYLARSDGSETIAESAQRSYDYLSESVPVRDEWDVVDALRSDRDRTEVETDG